MPLYEYECQACGNQLEAQQRLADAPLLTCPSCGKDQLQKIISATAFHLKGGGWYKDLYSSAKPGASGESGGGVPTSGAATKSDAKSESKSDGGKADSGSTAPAAGATSKSESSAGDKAAGSSGSSAAASAPSSSGGGTKTTAT